MNTKYITVRFSVRVGQNLDFGTKQIDIEVPVDYDEEAMFVVITSAVESQGN